MRNTRANTEVTPTAASATSKRSPATRILQAQDEERRKIGRELHDSVGQALAAAKIGIVKFKTEHAIGNGSELDETIRLLDSAIQEVRTVSHLLHPPDLDLVGLRASLAWYLEGFGQRTGIQTKLDAPEELPHLPAPAETAVFRVAQECLTNIHRHAQASEVVLRMRFTPAEFQLEVSDNGKGFADLDTCREGVGILGMQERMTELGGTLRVESGHGAGSSIYAAVPLLREAPAPIPRQPAAVVEGVVRILIVDDHPVIRHGIRSVVAPQPDMAVCGEASNAEQAVELASTSSPDVTILDLQLGGHNGWWVVRKLRASQLPTRIIIFSQYIEGFAQGSAGYGIDGFVSKGSDINELVDAIRTVSRGRRYFKKKTVDESA